MTGANPALDVPSGFALVRDGRGWTVLLTVIDSAPDVARLPSVVPLLRRIGAPYAIVGEGVAVPAAIFGALIEDHELLNGFDEVWLCSRPPRTGKPPGFQLTSDRPLPAALPAVHAAWMRDQGVVAGLGDGDGLRFVTADPALAAFWTP